MGCINCQHKLSPEPTDCCLLLWLLAKAARREVGLGKLEDVELTGRRVSRLVDRLPSWQVGHYAARTNNPSVSHEIKYVASVPLHNKNFIAIYFLYIIDKPHSRSRRALMSVVNSLYAFVISTKEFWEQRFNVGYLTTHVLLVKCVLNKTFLRNYLIKAYLLCILIGMS